VNGWACFATAFACKDGIDGKFAQATSRKLHLQKVGTALQEGTVCMGGTTDLCLLAPETQLIYAQQQKSVAHAFCTSVLSAQHSSNVTCRLIVCFDS
jgi:hypothetical protein